MAITSFTVRDLLTVTLNWDTEMLFGWTLRRTHCLMSDAKRRGSDERSHFSFLVHLQKKNKRKKECYYRLQTHTHTDAVTWAGLTPFHLLAQGKRRMSHRSLTDRVTHIYHISSVWATVASEREPGLQWGGSSGIKNNGCSICGSGAGPLGKGVSLVFVMLS